MSCRRTKLKTRESAKPILKEARERKKWIVESQEVLRKASKILDPNLPEKAEYFYPGVSHESWKFFLYGTRKVDSDIFKAYCEILELNWQEIAEPGEVKETELTALAASENPALPEQNIKVNNGAIEANNLGFELKLASDLVEARKQFELAIELNPDNAASYYNLALIYEDAEKYDGAIELYREAAFRGFAAAYCKLARLYVTEYKNWTKAIERSHVGLNLIENEKEQVEDDRIAESIARVKSSLLIYLAWAWKEQGRWKEALGKLQEAVKLESDRGLTYGIMAEVLENLGKKAEAIAAWKNCLAYGSSDERDEDIWIGKARQRLE
ncbi:MAG: tetratricopeptide repeat protein [Oscillatoriaceae cyanobacterium Prado104]|jgi:tetratricopeptide (TPR) repeat protein|nr:tetratricopeptide repeat protein [Oscillatoriaceae cyanobacterium Prado104]